MRRAAYFTILIIISVSLVNCKTIGHGYFFQERFVRTDKGLTCKGPSGNIGNQIFYPYYYLTIPTYFECEYYPKDVFMPQIMISRYDEYIYIEGGTVHIDSIKSEKEYNTLTSTPIKICIPTNDELKKIINETLDYSRYFGGYDAARLVKSVKDSRYMHKIRHMPLNGNNFVVRKGIFNFYFINIKRNPYRLVSDVINNFRIEPYDSMVQNISEIIQYR